MKKIAVSLFLFMFTVCSFAQNEHATFMGIPLNGTIEQFHKKIVAAGYKHDSIRSSKLPIGSRAFFGSFAGTNAVINVCYDETSKIVYRVIVDTYCRETIRDSVYNNFKGYLDEKYGSLPPLKKTYKGYDAYQYLELSGPDKKILGSIDLYLVQSPDYPEWFYIYVYFTDESNYLKHEKNRIDKLRRGAGLIK